MRGVGAAPPLPRTPSPPPIPLSIPFISGRPLSLCHQCCPPTPITICPVSYVSSRPSNIVRGVDTEAQACGYLATMPISCLRIPNVCGKVPFPSPLCTACTTPHRLLTPHILSSACVGTEGGRVCMSGVGWPPNLCLVLRNPILNRNLRGAWGLRPPALCPKVGGTCRTCV